MNNKPHTEELKSVTVTGSYPVARPDGRYAIVLRTKEQGAIAFEVNAIAIEHLRRQLAEIETMMKSPTGRA